MSLANAANFAARRLAVWITRGTAHESGSYSRLPSQGYGSPMFYRRMSLGARWSDGRVYGLQDPAEDAPILNRPLNSTTVAAPQNSVTGPAIVLGATTYASPGLHASLTAAAASSAAPVVRLGRDETSLARFADPLRRLERREGKILFDAWAIAAGTTVGLDDDVAFERAPVVEDTFLTREISLDADPEVVDGGKLVLGFTSPVVAPVGHWVELQRTNVLAAVGARLEQRRGLAALRFLSAPLRAMSFDANKLLAAMSRFGPGCDVHPTAWVENCIVGANVEIGPGAVIRNCVIGDEVRIDAQAIAELSVIGDRARLQRRCLANVSLVYPGARVGGILQLGLAGRDSALKMYGVGTDMRLDGPVRVRTPDGLVPVDIAYQGVCIGHRAFIGSGVWIAPGRVIENDRKVGRARELFVL